MAIVVKSVTTNAASGTGSSISITTPAASVGDLLIIILSNDYYNFSELTLTSISPTATATEVTGFGDDGGTNTAHFRAWWASVATAGAATVQCDTGHADEEKTLAVYVLSGADTSSPIDDAANVGTVQAAQQNPVAPSVSPATSNAFLLNHISSDGNSAGASSTLTAPGSSSNTYNITDPSSFMRSAGGSEQLSASGATGTRTWTGTRTDANWIAATMAIKTGASSTIPSVTTNAVTNITDTSAQGNGSVDSDGGSTITERGFVWNTSPNPTTAGSKIVVSGTTGSYSGTLSGLSDFTQYHVRAYAINAVGTAYGSDVTFIHGATLPWIST